MRVPGFRSSSFGRSFRLMSGSRNSVMTVAFDRSASNRSPWTNVARSDDAGLLRPALGQGHHVRVELDAKRPSRPAWRRVMTRDAVARAEVDHVVLRGDLRQVQHLVDGRLRRRHPDDVLAGLAADRFERRLRALGDCGQTRRSRAARAQRGRSSPRCLLRSMSASCPVRYRSAQCSSTSGARRPGATAPRRVSDSGARVAGPSSRYTLGTESDESGGARPGGYAEPCWSAGVCV